MQCKSGWIAAARAQGADAIVAAVAHRDYQALTVEDLGRKMVKGGAFIDVKAAFDEAALKAAGYRVWRL